MTALLDIYNEYINLLEKEIKSMTPFAETNGWKSVHEKELKKLSSKLQLEIEEYNRNNEPFENIANRSLEALEKALDEDRANGWRCTSKFIKDHMLDHRCYVCGKNVEICKCEHGDG